MRPPTNSNNRHHNHSATKRQPQQPQQQPQPPQPQQPPQQPLLRLDAVSEADRAQLRADLRALVEFERRMAMIHAPRRADLGPRPQPPHFGFRDLQRASVSERRALLGHTVLGALPLAAKIAGIARAPKVYHGEALPSALVACHDRLHALGLETTAAYAYLRDLVECEALADTVIQAAGSPLLPV
jgi:hypothetical protein